MDYARRIPFAPEDEERIASAGMWGIIVAITSIASSILSVIGVAVIAMKSPMGGAIIGALVVPGLISLTIGVVLAIFLYQASVAFRKVALTDEADQHYLLLGFGKLRNYFMMMGIVIIVVVSGMVLVFCGGIMCAGMMR